MRWLVLVVALAACRDNKPATADAGPKRPTTTSAGIAVGNMNSEIEVRLARKDRTANETEGLVELLLSRAHFLGKVADLEQADALAPAGSFARIHVDSALHRFDLALRELDAAQGLPAEKAAHTRATILQARGDFDGAAALEDPNVDHLDAQRVAGAAVLAAKMQKPAESERLFDLARSKIKDVSPFPLAWIDFQRASIYELAGDDARAKTWFTEAVDVLGVYAHAEVHLAATQPPADAIARLELIRRVSDDPEILAALAAAHQRAGDDATQLLADARTGYDALVAKHPEAFADHAARFWLGAGNDAAKALDLARRNKDNRPTEEALDLWMAAAAGAKKHDEVCAAASALLQLKYLSPRERQIATAAKCAKTP